MQRIVNSLPDGVVVKRVDERLSALGNIISCNDYVALVHPDIDNVLDSVKELNLKGNGGNYRGCTEG